MSARFDAAVDRLLRTTDLPDYNANYTWMGWIYLVSDLNAAGRLFALDTNSATNDFDHLGVNTDGTTLIARAALGAASTSTAGTNLSIATWYHIALMRTSTSILEFYLNGVLDGSVTRSIVTRTAITRLEAGAWTSGNANRTDSRMAAMKFYTTNLSVAEIANEMNTIRPQRTDNLYAWWPIFNGDRTTDYNSNVRPWTEAGTLTDEDPPPLSYGAPIYFIPWPTTTNNGVGAYTQASDTVAATGTADIAGVSSYTQASDTAGGAGTADIAGLAAYTQADDSVSSAGTVAITGTSAYTQADDTAGGAGTGDIAGITAYTQDSDTVIAAGMIAIVGAATYTQADDSLSAAGLLGSGTPVTFVEVGYTIIADARNTQVVAAPRITVMALDARNTEIIADARHTIIVADPRNTRIAA